MKLLIFIFLLPVSLYSPSFAEDDGTCSDYDCFAPGPEYDPKLSAGKATVVPDPAPGFSYDEGLGLGVYPSTPDGGVVVVPPKPEPEGCMAFECDFPAGPPQVTTDEGKKVITENPTDLVEDKTVCQECENDEAIANLTAGERAPAAAKPCNVVGEDGTCEEDMPSDDGTGAGAI